MQEKNDIKENIANTEISEEIIADSEINKYRFTTTFENEPLYRVLELLELSSPAIKIKYNPGKINKQTNIAIQSTVTISKKHLPMKH